VIVAPEGIDSTAVLFASASCCEICAAAVDAASFEIQKTSGAVSDVFEPHAPTVPTTGAGTPAPQFCPSVLPMRTKSPFWSIW
jgi:hypothetical protein